MPDLERLTDDLMIDLSKGDEAKHQYYIGYIAGKTTARKEIVFATIVLGVIICVFGFFAS